MHFEMQPKSNFRDVRMAAGNCLSMRRIFPAQNLQLFALLNEGGKSLTQAAGCPGFKKILTFCVIFNIFF